MIDNAIQPAWVLSTINEVINSSIICIEKIILFNFSEKTKIPFMYRLYQKVEKYFYPKLMNAMNGIHLSEVTVASPFIYDFIPRIENREYIFDESQVEDLELSNLDVIIYFGKYRLVGPIINAPKFGVWAYGSGLNYLYQDEEFWNVLENEPITSVALWRLGNSNNEDVLLYNSFTSTNTRSIASTLNRTKWKASRFVCRKLNDLYFNRDIECKSHNNRYNAEKSHHKRSPSNIDFMKRLPNIVIEYSKDKINYKFNKSRWIIAYHMGPTKKINHFDKYNFKIISPASGMHWADPFPCVHDGKACIFFEEIPKPGERGHISLFNLENNKNRKLQSEKIIESDYHMSYPFLFKWRKELFMIPETSQNCTIQIYRCNKYPYEWELIDCIFEDVRAVDTTLIHIDDVWWLFTSFATEHCKYFNDELSIYYSKSPFGPWKSHRKNPVISDVRVARSAGNLFYDNGFYFRPSQNSSGVYGHTISINKICRLTSDEYAEKQVFSIFPNWYSNLLGTHTFNSIEGLTVIDGFWQKKLI